MEIPLKRLKSTALILLTLTSMQTHGQNKEHDQTMYLELGGSAGFWSLNYEQIDVRSNQPDLFWRLGFGAIPIDRNSGSVLAFPITYGAIMGTGNHRAEVSIGQGLSVTTRGGLHTYTLPVAGYRYMSEDRRVFFRVTYTPLVSYIFDFQVQHWAGISVGYQLN